MRGGCLVALLVAGCSKAAAPEQVAEAFAPAVPYTATSSRETSASAPSAASSAPRANAITALELCQRFQIAGVATKCRVDKKDSGIDETVDFATPGPLGGGKIMRHANDMQFGAAAAIFGEPSAGMVTFVSPAAHVIVVVSTKAPIEVRAKIEALVDVL